MFSRIALHISRNMYTDHAFALHIFGACAKFQSLFVLSELNPRIVTAGSEIRRIWFCRLYFAKVQNPPPVQVFGQKCYFGMKKSVFSAAYPCCYSRPCIRVMTIAFGLSAVYPVAGKDALRVVMYDFTHFGHQVGRVDPPPRGPPPRAAALY